MSKLIGSFFPSSLFYFIIFFASLLFSSELLAQQTKMKIYYPDDTLEVELIYKSLDSLETGKLQAYFKDEPSILAYEKNFYYGKQSGQYKEYYPSGRLMIFAIYQVGKLNGDWTYYGTDGAVRIKAQYRNGIKHGYYADRVAHMQGRYKDGVRHGKWELNVGSAAYRKVWYSEGKLTSKPALLTRAKDLVDFSKEKGESGELKSDSSLKSESQDLYFNTYDTLYLPAKNTDSLKAYAIHYLPADSIFHPSMRQAVFVDNPQQTAVVLYIYEGKQNGLYKVYYPNGNIYIYAKYHYGRLEGDWKEYNAYGSLKIRGRYREGKRHGKWMFNIGQKDYYTKKYKDGELK